LLTVDLARGKISVLFFYNTTTSTSSGTQQRQSATLDTMVLVGHWYKLRLELLPMKEAKATMMGDDVNNNNSSMNATSSTVVVGLRLERCGGGDDDAAHDHQQQEDSASSSDEDMDMEERDCRQCGPGCHKTLALTPSMAVVDGKSTM
jgi:hypothetical protein